MLGSMNTSQKECKKNLPNVIFDESLAKYSTFKIGGSADIFYKLTDTIELSSILKFCSAKKIPYFIFSGGSNILFDDKGFRGIIIKIATRKIAVIGNKIIAEAGVLISELVDASYKHGLTGLEKWAALPGTVGGAVRGNAGCNGLETKDILVNATIFDVETGKIETVNNKYFKFKYRYSNIKDTRKIVLDATFELKTRKISEKKQKEIIEQYKKVRKEKQPLGFTAGSFFKNPSPDNPAGMLIEKAGLKGKIIGKAQISEKHANFFLNLGGASSEDIIELAKLAKREVKAKFGISLEEEIQIIGTTGKIKL